MQQHVILCGLGRVGWPVLDYLKAAGLAVTAVDVKALANDPRLSGVRFIQGDCRQPEMLEQAGLGQARGVLILTSDDLVNISTTLMVRHLNPEVRVVVRLFNQNLLSRLGKAVPNVFALSVSALTAPVLALTALTGAALGSFSLPDGMRQVAEVVASARNGWPGRSIAEIAEQQRLAVLAHLPRAGRERLLGEVGPATRLAADERLVVCGKPEDLAPLVRDDELDLLPHLRWAGWLRRSGRILARTFAEIETPVQISSAVLLVVVIGSMLVYHWGMNLSLPQGLFRTISLMATGSDMHEEELTEGWQKVFASIMRLLGTALIATFTAIITNYLLRVRLGKALEIRRIPDSGHIVVCGLGNIGFRVVEELLKCDERPVVIEKSIDSRFIATARRQGIAVIVGDATVLEVLRQANAGSARSVITATDNQLANLEIALLARELNPRQRVVLRLEDPHLAQVLREANIRLALATSALAAPVFVAALFGDRVPSLFLIAGRILAVVELDVHPDDPCLHGLSVRAVAIDHGVVALGLTTAGGKFQAPPAGHRLTADDTLTGILTLPDLARLLRRERAPATCSVAVLGFPPEARPWLAQALQARRKLDTAAVEKTLQTLPLILAEPLTRGQAEDLVLECRQQRIETRVSSAPA